MSPNPKVSSHVPNWKLLQSVEKNMPWNTLFWVLQHEDGVNHLTAPLFGFLCMARTSWRQHTSLTFRLSPDQLYLAEFSLASYLSHRIATLKSLPLSASVAGRIPHLTWRWLPAGAVPYIPPYWAETFCIAFFFFPVYQTASANIIFQIQYVDGLSFIPGCIYLFYDRLSN